MAGGGGARLAANDPLARAKLLAVATLELKASARIRLAAVLDPENLPPSVAAQVTEQVESGVDPVTGTLYSRRRRRLGALVLEDRTVAADPVDSASALADAAAAKLREGKLDLLGWNEAARQFQARVGLMHGLEPEIWPDLSDAGLAKSAPDWLPGWMGGMRGLGDLSRLDVLEILRGMLDYRLLKRLDEEMPTHLALSRSRASVDYTQPVPMAEARAQFFYGMEATPKLAGGRIPLRLALLSPAGRPIAVTADLAGFWRGGWLDARRDMRGRYPKHDWPENPAKASPPPERKPGGAR